MNFEPDIEPYRGVFWELPQPLAEALEDHFFPPSFRCYFPTNQNLLKDLLQNEEKDVRTSVEPERSRVEKVSYSYSDFNPVSPKSPDAELFEFHIPGDVVLLIYECLAKYNPSFRKLRKLTGREKFEFDFPPEPREDPFETYYHSADEETYRESAASSDSEREIDYGSSECSELSGSDVEVEADFGLDERPGGRSLPLPKDPRIQTRKLTFDGGWLCNRTSIHWRETRIEIESSKGLCGFTLKFESNHFCISYWNAKEYIIEFYDTEVSFEYSKNGVIGQNVPSRSVLDLFLKWPLH